MLPSVMRADYQKYIYLTDELSEELQDQLFYGLEEISWDQAQERGLLPQLMALRKQQKVDIRYEVTTRNKVKMVRFIQAAKEFEQLEEIRLGLRKGAKKKEQLLYYLQRLGTEKVTAVKEMKELGFSTALLNEAAKNGWLTFIEKKRIVIRLLIRRLKNDCVIFECRTTGGCGNNLTIGPRTAKPNLLIGRYYRKRENRSLSTGHCRSS